MENPWLSEETMAQETEEIDLDALIERELPVFGSQPLKRFVLGRDGFNETEQRKRSDWVFRQGETQVGKLAGSIVDVIRGREAGEPDDPGSLWGPGVPWETVKQHLAGSRLWNIVRRMPKGALLHAHLDASVDVRLVVQWILETPGICMKAEHALSDDYKLASVPFVFCVSVEVTNSIPPWHECYSSNAVIDVQLAAQSFPGGIHPFRDWLISRLTIIPTQAAFTPGGIAGIWAVFASKFPVIRSVIFYEPIWRKYCRQAFRQLVADNVWWAEFRLDFNFEFTLNEATGPLDTLAGFDAAVRIFGEELHRYQATQDGSAFWGARLIWTNLRSLPTKEIVRLMLYSIQVKKAHPTLIAGYDLVGHESAGRPLIEICPELFWYSKECAAEGVLMPFFFHAGECLSTGDDTEGNMLTAVLLGTRRMGHGTALYRHPQLMRTVTDKRILIECCPISNEILRLVSGVHAHPFPALIANGVAVSLSCDDPAIFGHHTIEPDSPANFGQSPEFWQALRAFDDLGLAGLGSLAENSVRWAAYEDQDAKSWLSGILDGTVTRSIKSSRMKEWATSWEKFCIWIVEEYGTDIMVI